MVTDEQIRTFIAQQFEEVNPADIGEDHRYRTWQFNTLLNVAGEGDFRPVIMEREDGSLEIVDYEALT